MKKITIIMLFALVSLTWGTTWLAMRVAVETIPPVFATGMRFLFAAPFLIAIAWFTKTPLLFPAGQRMFQMVVCVFYFAIPFTLMIYGEKYISSGLASIIFANMPIAVLVMSILLLKEKTNILQVVGLTISIVSLSCILLAESKTGAAVQWQGILMLVSAVIIHAVMYTQCKKRCCKVPVITFNALPCFAAGILLTSGGWLVERPDVATFSLISLTATLYLGAFAGVFGILCYFALQQRASAFQASIVFLIFPLIALSLENYIYGDTLMFYSRVLIIPLTVGILMTITANNLIMVKNEKAVS